MLESLGLDGLTTAAYRVWLREPGLGISEVAVRLGAPESAVVQAQENLLGRGLLLQSWETPGALVPVNPEVAVERLYREQQAELARQQEQLAKARVALTELVEDYARGTNATPQPNEGVGELHGIDAIRAAITDLGRRTEHEMLAMHPSRTHSPEALEAALELDVQAIRRGVALRSIYHEAAKLDEPTREYHRRAAQAGMQIRYAKTVPMRMLIFDRDAGLVPLHPVDTGRGAMLVRGHALAAVLVLSFEQLWAQSEPHDDGGTAVVTHREGIDPSDSDRTLLQLLSLGVKDEAAARHLGVSVRTVRRQIADLMKRLEAESRFQAGMRAAARGWL